MFSLIRKIGYAFLCGTFLTFSSATWAQGGVDFGVIDAKIGISTGNGSFSESGTFALGQNLFVTGCFSQFIGSTGSPFVCYEDNFGLQSCFPNFLGDAANESVCDRSTRTSVKTDWVLTNDTTSQSVSFSDPIYSSLSTGGIGDFINAAGSYTLMLTTTSSFGGEFISLSPVGHIGVQTGGIFDQATTSFTITSASSVPEPASALLLIPALAFVGRRQRQRRKLEKRLL